MLHLCVENQQECPIEGFITLGLSTSRGHEDCIGQFGSGNKHAVLLLLRSGLNPIIYSGTTKLEFYTEPALLDTKSYNKVFVKIGNNKAKELSYCLEFGELDWTSLDMALREIVSNAIDNGGFSNMEITVTDSLRAKSGTTRIYIPLIPDVQRFYSSISQRFLHYTDKENQSIIEKESVSPAKIYRKGVLVREVKEDSLFDYNFGDELPIDECRKLDNYTVACHASRVIVRNEEGLTKIIRSLFGAKEFFEHTFSYYSMYNVDKQALQNAWQVVTGNAVCCNNGLAVETLQRKGFKCAIITQDNWYRLLTENGISSPIDKLTEVEKQGQQIVPTSNNAIKTLNQVWYWLTELNLNQNKIKPPIKCFSKAMSCETLLRGYYQDGTIYVNIENDTESQTILEECAHYITGATDNSRDFQDFAFLFGKRAAEILFD